MSYELIISEKPQAAQKIAQSLSDTTPKKIRERKVNYYTLTHNGKNIVVASAVGHLYTLREKGGESWKYPVFETEWKPTYKVSKEAAYTKEYLQTLQELGEQAEEITLASDFDVEGEVIGANIIKYALKKKDAKRMKFSTLTKAELVKSYNNKLPTLEWGLADAGDTRHHLDWFYGINLSRAFMTAIKKSSNMRKVLSTGRVQGPALHFLAQREKLISKFKPEKYIEIYLKGRCEEAKIRAQYELPLKLAKEQQSKKKTIDRTKIFDLEFAKKIVEETQKRQGTITQIAAKQFKQNIPFPFDLTSLQMEASNLFGFSPKKTLEIAQKLYISGVTSYPRTSSQKIPKQINIKQILDKLEIQPPFKDKVQLIKKINPKINPNQGKKDDPAHPSIHPTGELPKKLETAESKLYDLIAKRFFSVFGSPAIRETNTIEININSHLFLLKGTRTIEKGWHKLYEPYVKFDEVTLPKLEKGQKVKNEKIEKEDKETTPPKRFTDASIIKELEKRNIGTKATRADILENLRKREYITDKSIKVTPLGIAMDKVLEEETPKLIDEALTRQFEEEMEEIKQKKTSPKNILKVAKKELTKILDDISLREKEIGVKLSEASKLVYAQATTISKCPNCKFDGNLVIKYSRKTKRKFAACDKYPECKTIFNLPKAEILKPTKQKEEGKIIILAGSSKRNLREVWINEEKEEKEKELKEDEKKYKEVGMKCPNCEEGKMALRKSFYGEFLGCDNYPKCKTMMKITKGKVDTTPITPNKKKK